MHTGGTCSESPLSGNLQGRCFPNSFGAAEQFSLHMSDDGSDAAPMEEDSPVQVLLYYHIRIHRRNMEYMIDVYILLYDFLVGCFVLIMLVAYGKCGRWILHF